jgi:hypothetical protein
MKLRYVRIGHRGADRVLRRPPRARDERGHDARDERAEERVRDEALGPRSDDRHERERARREAADDRDELHESVREQERGGLAPEVRLAPIEHAPPERNAGADGGEVPTARVVIGATGAAAVERRYERATCNGLADTGDGVGVLSEEERHRTVRLPTLDEEIAGLRVGAPDDVVLSPLAAPECDVDDERHEGAAGLVERRGRLSDAHTTLARDGARAREATGVALLLRERLHEAVLDAPLDLRGQGRLIGRGERGGERENGHAQREPHERFHDGSFR